MKHYNIDKKQVKDTMKCTVVQIRIQSPQVQNISFVYISEKGVVKYI